MLRVISARENIKQNTIPSDPIERNCILLSEDLQRLGSCKANKINKQDNY